MSRGFRSLHPAISFLYYTGAVLLLFLMNHPLFLLTSFFLLFAVNLLYDGGKAFFQWKGMMLMTAGVILIVNPLTSERGSHVLWVISGHHITLESILYGGIMAITMINVMAVFTSYQQVISSDKFLYLFAGFLPQWSLLTMMSLRFVPLLRTRIREIALVQQSRMNPSLKPSWKEQVVQRMKRLEVLLTWSLEDGLQTAESMKARGYGTGRRTSYSPYHWSLKDGISFLFLSATFGACISGWATGWGTLAIYPVMEPLLPDLSEWLLLVSYLFYYSFPVWIELGG